MHRNRGATLVEMVFTMSLTAMVITTTVALYAFVAVRAGDATTKYNSFQQSKDLMLAISNVTSNAISCSNVTLGSVTALKCTVPNAGIDRDRNGIYEQYDPAGVYKTLKEYYAPGQRIWFFPSSNPPVIGTAGSFWYRAIRTDDTNILSSDIDSKWSYVTGTTPKIYIPGTVTFTQNAANLTTNVLIQLDTGINPNASMKGFSGNLGNKLPGVTLSRRFFWRSAF